MKSLQKSYGKKLLYSLLALYLWPAIGLVSCATKTVYSANDSASLSSEGGSDEATKKQEVSLETTLANDQKTIEELRKNVPPEKRTENDQLKELLSLTGEVKDDPSKIRERFNRITQRMRQDERRDSQKTRETFNREEKRVREDFYDKLKVSREKFKKEKVTPEQRKRFFDDQERARKDFTANERDQRNRFNADEKAKSDDFNSMIRSKTQDFTQEMRAYTQRYNDHKKAQEEARRLKNQPPAAPTATPLKTGNDGP